MSLTAEYRLRTPYLPLSDVVGAVPDLTIQIEDEEQLQSGPLLFLIRVTGPSFNELDVALDASPLIEKYSLISEVGSTRLYQLTMTIHRPAAVEKILSSKMVAEGVTVLPDGWQVKQLFASRDEFTEVRDFARRMDISFQLDRLYESTSTDTELIGLTDKQREALLAAYEEGYFAVPRQASMAAVADELDISPAALTERLHRAQSHLIEHFVHSDAYKTPTDLDTD